MTAPDTPRGCIFTGHRTIPETRVKILSEILLSAVDSCYVIGIRDFYAGGALGFDTLAADAVLAYRKSHPDVRLHLILPCRGQEDRWSFKDKFAYRKQLSRADTVTYLAPAYYDGCMRARHRALVEHGTLCLAYMTNPRSGSAQTWRMAQAAGLRCVNLANSFAPLPEGV